jgi:hypothetical protein
MSDQTPPAPSAEPGAEQEIPRFRFAEKKVDVGWKEEVRREREVARSEPPPGRAPGPEARGAPPGRGAAPTDPAKQASRVFLTFLAQIVQQGFMQLGQVESPFTGQREVDLDGARFTIDLLGVLQQRTKGNLTDQETRMLSESLRELQLQYVAIAREVGRQMKEGLQRGPDRGGPARR